MNGVDKITQNILSEAKELAKITILQAEKQRDSEVSKAAEDARLKADAKVERAKKEALELCERAKSTSSLERRKQILQAKREVINEVFDRIELSFMQMDTDSYTNLLIKMASSDKNGGILKFSTKDINIAGKVFEGLNHDKFKLSEETADNIKSGFLLINGDVETNFSIQELIQEYRQTLEPEITKILFCENIE